MTFIWPMLLFTLILVPLLVGAYLWLLRRRKKMTVSYAHLALVKQAMKKGSSWRRHVPPALMLLALALMLFASARPQHERRRNMASPARAFFHRLFDQR